jgi:hypothetical protein
MNGVSSWAVFLDNATMLNTVLEYYKSGRGNGRLEHYIYESGQCQESGRDQGHTQLGISGLTQTALTLYHALNSTEPFTYADYRLRKGLEYTAMVCANSCFRAIYIQKRSFYQDRLGTNIGKTQKRNRCQV